MPRSGLDRAGRVSNQLQDAGGRNACLEDHLQVALLLAVFGVVDRLRALYYADHLPLIVQDRRTAGAAPYSAVIATASTTSPSDRVLK